MCKYMYITAKLLAKKWKKCLNLQKLSSSLNKPMYHIGKVTKSLQLSADFMHCMSLSPVDLLDEGRVDKEAATLLEQVVANFLLFLSHGHTLTDTQHLQELHHLRKIRTTNRKRDEKGSKRNREGERNKGSNLKRARAKNYYEQKNRRN